MHYSPSDEPILDDLGCLPGHSPNCLKQTGRLFDAQGVCWQSCQLGYQRDLLTHFSRAGEVVGALAVSDKASGLCRGFGLVEMAELSDVAVAFSLLNNTELNGQKIKIEPDPAMKNGKARNKVVDKRA